MSQTNFTNMRSTEQRLADISKEFRYQVNPPKESILNFEPYLQRPSYSESSQGESILSKDNLKMGSQYEFKSSFPEYKKDALLQMPVSAHSGYLSSTQFPLTSTLTSTLTNQYQFSQLPPTRYTPPSLGTLPLASSYSSNPFELPKPYVPPILPSPRYELPSYSSNSY